MNYDVFNGDADGIIALHQLRLDASCTDAQLITGVKRDIHLLRNIDCSAGDSITVLDISLDSNREHLLKLLNNNCQVLYIDHHFAGQIPDSAFLDAHIDTNSDICTSLIVDRIINGRYRSWAIAAAFGDNLHNAAINAAQSISISNSKLDQLRELGELINYNGYGATINDLHFHPRDLYNALHPYENPFDFYNNSQVLAQLREGFEEDMTKARNTSPHLENKAGRIYFLPSEPWARRASGVFSNERAREKPDLAHTIIIENNDKSFRISVRAPLNNRKGADTLCLAFPTGGGRVAAAGINALPAELLDAFVNSFIEVFTS